MCDRILPRANKHCNRPSSTTLFVEVTGEVLHLCDVCARFYEQGVPITYTPRRPG